MSEGDARIRRRAPWLLRLLTLVVVPAWLFAIFVGAYLIEVWLSPVGGPPARAPGLAFTSVSATVAVLALPALGLFWVWRGRAAARRRMMRAGVALLCVWLLGEAAFFALSEIAAGARQNPGTWADPYFRISEKDRQTYRPSRSGLQLSVIVPQARDLDPRAGAGAQVPVIATAEIGQGSLAGIRVTGDAICDGALDGIAIPEAARGRANPDRLRSLFAGNPKSYRFWMSAKRDWVAMCDPKTARCEAIFLNNGWIADFPLEREALCRAPAMNARFAALVERWKRK
jgi:hypothetical protein